MVLCVSLPDPTLNPAAHLVGVGESGERGGKEAAEDPALRLRLCSILAACLDYVERELNMVSCKYDDACTGEGQVVFIFASISFFGVCAYAYWRGVLTMVWDFCLC